MAGKDIVAVNAGDKDWTRHRYILAFGAYCERWLMVWANSLDDALEECGGWIADNAPGLFCDDAVASEYAIAKGEGLSDEQAQERAEQDTTQLDGGHYLCSWEWGIVAEDPTRAEVLALMGREARAA